MPLIKKVKGRVSFLKADIISLLIVSYAFIILFGSFKLPAYLTGTAAGLIVLMAALRWGVPGGVISAFFSSGIVITSMHIFQFEIKYAVPGIIAYFISGFCIGKAREIFQKQQGEIKKSEQKYRTIVENTNDAIYITDFRGNIMEVNNKACQMLGYERHELIGSHILKIVRPDFVASLHNWVMELLNCGSIVFESWHVRKDCSEVPVESSVVIVSGEGDGIMQSFVRDISERKRVEEELLRSHRLITVLNSIDAFIYVADMQTYEILFVNDYGKKKWGDIRGRTCWKYIWKSNYAPCTFCTNENLVDKHGKPTGVYEWEHYNEKDNRWYLCRDRAIKWIDGRLVRGQIATDITERKFGEELLMMSHRRLLTVLDSIDSIIYVTDLDSHEILFLNNSAKKRWGDITGNKCWQTIHENESGPCSVCKHDKLKRIGGKLEGVHKWEYYDEYNKRWYEHRDRAFNWVDNRPVCLSVVTDITERIKSEEDKYRIKLYSAIEKERINLARDLHDEVGMALTVVKLDLQMLNRKCSDVDSDLSENIKKSIDVVNKSQQSVRSKSAFLRPPALDDLGLINVLKNLTDEIGGQSGINVILSTTGDKADFPVELETALYRCIQEALTNVVRHSSAETVTLDLFLDDREVSVKIKDDGIGFNVEQVNSLKDKMGIRGMKERVFLMRGLIDIISTPGEGTAIYITIPLEDHKEIGDE